VAAEAVTAQLSQELPVPGVLEDLLFITGPVTAVAVAVPAMVITALMEAQLLLTLHLPAAAAAMVLLHTRRGFKLARRAKTFLELTGSEAAAAAAWVFIKAAGFTTRGLEPRPAATAAGVQDLGKHRWALLPPARLPGLRIRAAAAAAAVTTLLVVLLHRALAARLVTAVLE
jgi:hypothetical protein